MPTFRSLASPSPSVALIVRSSGPLATCNVSRSISSTVVAPILMDLTALYLRNYPNVMRGILVIKVVTSVRRHDQWLPRIAVPFLEGGLVRARFSNQPVGNPSTRLCAPPHLLPPAPLPSMTFCATPFSSILQPILKHAPVKTLSLWWHQFLFPKGFTLSGSSLRSNPSNNFMQLPLSLDPSSTSASHTSPLPPTPLKP